MPEIHENFDPQKAKLQDTNLIEASAGTGKTYSLALMTLRLVITGAAPIDQILMVTYTNAAVAELEIRVRSFIRKALVVARQETGEIEPDIRNLVESQIESENREKVITVLSDAELMLDQTSIMTIHGFCQRSLMEYAFETRQLFKATALDPEEFGEIISDTFNHIWRNYITIIPADILKNLMSGGLTYHSLKRKVNAAITGDTIYLSEQMPEDFLSSVFFEQERQRIQRSLAEIRQKEEEVQQSIDKNSKELVQSLNSMKEPPYPLIEAINSGELISVVLLINKQIKKIPAAFSDLLNKINEWNDLQLVFKRSMLNRINQLALFSYGYVKEKIDQILSGNGLMTFDDMIVRLHEGVCIKKHPGLIQKLRERYKAVFVDEFQDTDKLQYEIFFQLFQQPDYRDTPLFYIGDPKQLIYGWRKADLNTYFRSADSVDHIYRMKTNHRSHPDMIRAMNYFFDPAPGSNFFHFDINDIHRVEYEQVNAVVPTKKPRLIYMGEKPPPIQFVFSKNKKQTAKNTAAIVRALLDSNLYQLDYGDRKENIKPADIGIIVRVNTEGDQIKELLASMKIPAVTIRELRILQSEEAKEIYYFLIAALQLSRSSINRALLTKICGWKTEDIFTSDEENILERFRQYYDSWKEKGVYLMLRKWLSDNRLVSRLFDSQKPLQERFVANCFQLIELLHTTEQKKSFSPEELIHWLKKGIDGELNSGDEYVQRMESDAEAVNIVTVHKSKGLEYKIVILPYMDLTVKNAKEFRFRNVDGVYYNAVSEMISNIEIAMYRKQEEQENKRLLYVAVTRACTHCFIFTKPLPSSAKKGVIPDSYSVVRKTLLSFSADEMSSKGIGYESAPMYDPGNVYRTETTANGPAYTIVPKLALRDLHWQVTSYSSLNPEHGYTLGRNQSTIDYPTELDYFIFKTLPRGRHIGNLLHLILEKIDFSDEKNWNYLIEKAVRTHIPLADVNFTEQLTLFIRQIVLSKIPYGENGFSLSEVHKKQRLNELEFDLPLKSFNTADFMQLPSEVPLKMRSISELEGILNGKIDLFFEHKGVYYLLDWKSNYLGDSLKDYEPGNLYQSMEENNYFLQYHLYVLSVYRYLKTRKKEFSYERDFGGVAYVYMRGVRSGSSNGIYFHKPDPELILKMETLMLKKQLINARV
jgi:exodeoxyribonuclease V beta subunit